MLLIFVCNVITCLTSHWLIIFNFSQSVNIENIPQRSKEKCINYWEIDLWHRWDHACEICVLTFQCERKTGISPSEIITFKSLHDVIAENENLVHFLNVLSEKPKLKYKIYVINSNRTSMTIHLHAFMN